jgi:DNA polymerase III epsilon subunit family exonuclease
VETAGQIGAIELIGGVRTGVQFHSYIVHRKESFPLALQCHGLAPSFLASKPPPALVIPAFVKFVDGAVLVGHNVSFDLRMLNAELARLSMPLVPGVAVLCTKQLFKAVFPMHTDQKKLDDLLDFFGVERNNLRKNAHGALLDADLTVELFQALLFCIPAEPGGAKGRQPPQRQPQQPQARRQRAAAAAGASAAASAAAPTAAHSGGGGGGGGQGCAIHAPNPESYCSACRDSTNGSTNGSTHDSTNDSTHGSSSGAAVSSQALRRCL